jgi:uncharacterized membrane protein
VNLAVLPLALFMIAAGIGHFTATRGFEQIVPAWLPAPRMIVYVSGVAEMAGGAGLLWPPTRPWAAWGLVALYVAVFPANLNQALHRIPLGRWHAPQWVLWLRLPLQLVLVDWAYTFTRA